MDSNLEYGLLDLSDVASNLDDEVPTDLRKSRLGKLAFRLATLGALKRLRNPDFSILFKYRDAYTTVAALAPLTLAPGLSDLLHFPSPPSLEYFKTLP